MTLTEPRSYLIRLLIACAGLLLLAYVGFEARHLILGPSITLESPHSGAHLETNLLEIRGTTRNIARLHLNDRPIFIDESGRFSEKLVLPPGYTIMTLEGEDRFGRRTTEVIRLTHSR